MVCHDATYQTKKAWLIARSRFGNVWRTLSWPLLLATTCTSSTRSTSLLAELSSYNLRSLIEIFRGSAAKAIWWWAHWRISIANGYWSRWISWRRSATALPHKVQRRCEAGAPNVFSTWCGASLSLLAAQPDSVLTRRLALEVWGRVRTKGLAPRGAAALLAHTSAAWGLTFWGSDETCGKGVSRWGHACDQSHWAGLPTWNCYHLSGQVWSQTVYQLLDHLHF